MKKLKKLSAIEILLYLAAILFIISTFSCSTPNYINKPKLIKVNNKGLYKYPKNEYILILGRKERENANLFHQIEPTITQNK